MMIRKAILLIMVMTATGGAAGQTAYDFLLKAGALMTEGNANQAVAVLSEYPRINDNSRLLTLMGDAKLLTGDYQGAIVDFNSANRIKEHSGDYGLARAYALSGDRATSLNHLESSMRSPFKRSEKEIMLDPAFTRIDNSPEWRLFWRKDWYTVPELKVSETEFYIRAGKTGEARNVLAEFERDYRGNPAVIYAGALIKIAEGSFSEAVGMLSGLLSGDPSGEKYLRALARAQTGASNHAGASVTLSKLISMEVPDPDLFLLRAASYSKTGERQKAMADIDRYLSWYPGSKSALSLAGKIESTLGNNLKAMEYFSENVRLHPNDPECYIDRGNSYSLSKSWQWAINDYSMSLDLQPENSEAWLSKGIAILNTGRIEDACHDFRRAFALGNKNAVGYLSKHCIR